MKLSKLIANILIVCFACQEIAWSAPAFSSPIPQSSDPFTLKIPLNYVSLREMKKGREDKLIIHIQDAHANLSGQENLAAALNELMDNGRVGLIFSEGGSGDCSLTELKKLAAPGVWKQVAKKHLVQGNITGEEYLNLVSDHPMKIIGIEDMNLYFKTIQSYAKLAEKREEILSYLKEVRSKVEKIKNRMYPQDLLEHEKEAVGNMKREYEKDRGGQLKNLLNFLVRENIDLSATPSVAHLRSLMDREKGVNFEAAGLEQSALLQEVEKRDSAWVREFAEKSNKARRQTASQFVLLKELKAVAAKHGISFSDSPNLAEYYSYLEEFNQLNLEATIVELQVLEEALYTKKLPSEDAQLVRAIDRYLNLLESAYQIRMTSDEFSAFQTNAPDFRAEAYLGFINRKLAEFEYFDNFLIPSEDMKDAEAWLKEFYNSVAQRDTAFLENIEKTFKQENKKEAVLITGGYHTSHLKELFNSRGYSYVVLTPYVTSETNQKKYERLLLEPLQKGSEPVGIRRSSAGADEKRATARQLLTMQDPQGARLAALRKDAGINPSSSGARIPAQTDFQPYETRGPVREFTWKNFSPLTSAVGVEDRDAIVKILLTNIEGQDDERSYIYTLKTPVKVDGIKIVQVQIKGGLLRTDKELRAHQGSGFAAMRPFGPGTASPEGGAYLSAAQNEFEKTRQLWEDPTRPKNIMVKVPLGWGKFDALKFQDKDLGFVLLGIPENAQERLDNKQRPLKELLKIFRHAGAGLSWIHRKGLLHEGYHPGNLSYQEGAFFGILKPNTLGIHDLEVSSDIKTKMAQLNMTGGDLERVELFSALIKIRQELGKLIKTTDLRESLSAQSELIRAFLQGYFETLPDKAKRQSMAEETRKEFYAYLEYMDGLDISEGASQKSFAQLYQDFKSAKNGARLADFENFERVVKESRAAEKPIYLGSLAQRYQVNLSSPEQSRRAFAILTAAGYVKGPVNAEAGGPVWALDLAAGSRLSAREKKIGALVSEIVRQDLRLSEQYAKIQELNTFLNRRPENVLEAEDTLAIYTSFVGANILKDISQSDMEAALEQEDSAEVEFGLVTLINRMGALAKDYPKIELNDSLVSVLVLALVNHSQKVRAAAIESISLLPQKQGMRAKPILTNMINDPSTEPFIVYELIKFYLEPSLLVSDIQKQILRQDQPKLVVRQAAAALGEIASKENNGKATQALIESVFKFEIGKEALAKVIKELARSGMIEKAAPVIVALMAYENDEISQMAEKAFNDHMAERIDRQLAAPSKMAGARLAGTIWHKTKVPKAKQMNADTVMSNLKRIGDNIHVVHMALEDEDQYYDKKDFSKKMVRQYGRAIDQAFNKVLLNGPVTAQDLETEFRHFHIMLGRRGVVPVSVGYYSTEDQTEIRRIFDWLMSDEVTEAIARNPKNAIEIAARVFVNLVNLQSYKDGNKRASNLIMNFILIRSGLEPFYLTLENAADYAKIVRPINVANKISEKKFADFLEDYYFSGEAGARLADQTGRRFSTVKQMVTNFTVRSLFAVTSLIASGIGLYLYFFEIPTDSLVESYQKEARRRMVSNPIDYFEAYTADSEDLTEKNVNAGVEFMRQKYAEHFNQTNEKGEVTGGLIFELSKMDPVIADEIANGIIRAIDLVSVIGSNSILSSVYMGDELDHFMYVTVTDDPAARKFRIDHAKFLFREGAEFSYDTAQEEVFKHALRSILYIEYLALSGEVWQQISNDFQSLEEAVEIEMSKGQKGSSSQVSKPLLEERLSHYRGGVAAVKFNKLMKRYIDDYIDGNKAIPAEDPDFLALMYMDELFRRGKVTWISFDARVDRELSYQSLIHGGIISGIGFISSAYLAARFVRKFRKTRAGNQAGARLSKALIDDERLPKTLPSDFVIVAPAFNEEASLLKSIQEARRQGYLDRVIFINDGSGDGTLNILRSESGVYFISYDENQQKEGAIASAINHLRSRHPNFPEYVVSFDGGDSFLETPVKNSTVIQELTKAVKSLKDQNAQRPVNQRYVAQRLDIRAARPASRTLLYHLQAVHWSMVMVGQRALSGFKGKSSGINGGGEIYRTENLLSALQKIRPDFASGNTQLGDHLKEEGLIAPAIRTAVVRTETMATVRDFIKQYARVLDGNAYSLPRRALYIAVTFVLDYAVFSIGSWMAALAAGGMGLIIIAKLQELLFPRSARRDIFLRDTLMYLPTSFALYTAAMTVSLNVSTYKFFFTRQRSDSPAPLSNVDQNAGARLSKEPVILKMADFRNLKAEMQKARVLADQVDEKLGRDENGYATVFEQAEDEPGNYQARHKWDGLKFNMELMADESVSEGTQIRMMVHAKYGADSFRKAMDMVQLYAQTGKVEMPEGFEELRTYNNILSDIYNALRKGVENKKSSPHTIKIGEMKKINEIRDIAVLLQKQMDLVHSIAQPAIESELRAAGARFASPEAFERRALEATRILKQLRRVLLQRAVKEASTSERRLLGKASGNFHRAIHWIKEGETASAFNYLVRAWQSLYFSRKEFMTEEFVDSEEAWQFIQVNETALELMTQLSLVLKDYTDGGMQDVMDKEDAPRVLLQVIRRTARSLNADEYKDLRDVLRALHDDVLRFPENVGAELQERDTLAVIDDTLAEDFQRRVIVPAEAVIDSLVRRNYLAEFQAENDAEDREIGLKNLEAASIIFLQETEASSWNADIIGEELGSLERIISESSSRKLKRGFLSQFIERTRIHLNDAQVYTGQTPAAARQAAGHIIQDVDKAMKTSKPGLSMGGVARAEGILAVIHKAAKKLEQLGEEKPLRTNERRLSLGELDFVRPLKSRSEHALVFEAWKGKQRYIVTFPYDVPSAVWAERVYRWVAKSGAPSLLPLFKNSGEMTVEEAREFFRPFRKRLRGIVGPFLQGRKKNIPYLISKEPVMESAAERLVERRASKRFSEKEAASEILSILRALKQLHDHRYYHRSLTLNRILFGGEDNEAKVYFVDPIHFVAEQSGGAGLSMDDLRAVHPSADLLGNLNWRGLTGEDSDILSMQLIMAEYGRNLPDDSKIGKTLRDLSGQTPKRVFSDNGIFSPATISVNQLILLMEKLEGEAKSGARLSVSNSLLQGTQVVVDFGEQYPQLMWLASMGVVTAAVLFVLKVSDVWRRYSASANLEFALGILSEGGWPFGRYPEKEKIQKQISGLLTEMDGDDLNFDMLYRASLDLMEYLSANPQVTQPKMKPWLKKELGFGFRFAGLGGFISRSARTIFGRDSSEEFMAYVTASHHRIEKMHRDNAGILARIRVQRMKIERFTATGEGARLSRVGVIGKLFGYHERSFGAVTLKKVDDETLEIHVKDKKGSPRTVLNDLQRLINARKGFKGYDNFVTTPMSNTALIKFAERGGFKEIDNYSSSQRFHIWLLKLRSRWSLRASDRRQAAPDFKIYRATMEDIDKAMSSTIEGKSNIEAIEIGQAYYWGAPARTTKEIYDETLRRKGGKIREDQVSIEVKRFTEAFAPYRDGQGAQLGPLTSILNELENNARRDIELNQKNAAVALYELAMPKIILIRRMPSFERSAFEIELLIATIMNDLEPDENNSQLDLEARIADFEEAVGQDKTKRIIFMHELNPFVLDRLIKELGKDIIGGFVMDRGTMTSHAVILAGNEGLPVLKVKHGLIQPGVHNATVILRTDQIKIHPSTGDLEAAETEKTVWDIYDDEALMQSINPATTLDGIPIGVQANADGPDEIEQGLSNGAEGDGLVRTEYMFRKDNKILQEFLKVWASKDGYEIAREKLVLDFKEKFKAMAAAAGERDVTLRMYDNEKDKPMSIPNPEGNYGPDYYRTEIGEELLRIEVEAALEASAEAQGRIQILYPSYRSEDSLALRIGLESGNLETLTDGDKSKLGDLLMEDFDFAMVRVMESVRQKLIDKYKSKQMEAHADTVRNVLKGYMIEVPEQIDEPVLEAILRGSDYLNVGTNDLTTGLFRNLKRTINDEQVRGISRDRDLDQDYYETLQPKLLQALSRLADITARFNQQNSFARRIVCICGEIARLNRFALFTIYLKNKHGENFPVKLSALPSVVHRLKHFIQNTHRSNTLVFDRMNEQGVNINALSLREAMAIREKLIGQIANRRERETDQEGARLSGDPSLTNAKFYERMISIKSGNRIFIQNYRGNIVQPRLIALVKSDYIMLPMFMQARYLAGDRYVRSFADVIGEFIRGPVGESIMYKMEVNALGSGSFVLENLSDRIVLTLARIVAGQDKRMDYHMTASNVAYEYLAGLGLAEKWDESAGIVQFTFDKKKESVVSLTELLSGLWFLLANSHGKLYSFDPGIIEERMTPLDDNGRAFEMRLFLSVSLEGGEVFIQTHEIKTENALFQGSFGRIGASKYYSNITGRHKVQELKYDDMIDAAMRIAGIEPSQREQFERHLLESVRDLTEYMRSRLVEAGFDQAGLLFGNMDLMLLPEKDPVTGFPKFMLTEYSANVNYDDPRSYDKEVRLIRKQPVASPTVTGARLVQQVNIGIEAEDDPVLEPIKFNLNTVAEIGLKNLPIIRLRMLANGEFVVRPASEDSEIEFPVKRNTFKAGETIRIGRAGTNDVILKKLTENGADATNAVSHYQMQIQILKDGWVVFANAMSRNGLWGTVVQPAAVYTDEDQSASQDYMDASGGSMHLPVSIDFAPDRSMDEINSYSRIVDKQDANETDASEIQEVFLDALKRFNNRRKEVRWLIAGTNHIYEEDTKRNLEYFYRYAKVLIKKIAQDRTSPYFLVKNQRINPVAFKAIMALKISVDSIENLLTQGARLVQETVEALRPDEIEAMLSPANLLDGDKTYVFYGIARTNVSMKMFDLLPVNQIREGLAAGRYRAVRINGSPQILADAEEEGKQLYVVPKQFSPRTLGLDEMQGARLAAIRRDDPAQFKDWIEHWQTENAKGTERANTIYLVIAVNYPTRLKEYEARERSTQEDTIDIRTGPPVSKNEIGLAGPAEGETTRIHLDIFEDGSIEMDMLSVTRKAGAVDGDDLLPFRVRYTIQLKDILEKRITGIFLGRQFTIPSNPGSGLQQLKMQESMALFPLDPNNGAASRMHGRILFEVTGEQSYEIYYDPFPNARNAVRVKGSLVKDRILLDEYKSGARLAEKFTEEEVRKILDTFNYQQILTFFTSLQGYLLLDELSPRQALFKMFPGMDLDDMDTLVGYLTQNRDAFFGSYEAWAESYFSESRFPEVDAKKMSRDKQGALGLFRISSAMIELMPVFTGYVSQEAPLTEEDLSSQRDALNRVSGNDPEKRGAIIETVSRRYSGLGASGLVPAEMGANANRILADWRKLQSSERVSKAPSLTIIDLTGSKSVSPGIDYNFGTKIEEKIFETIDLANSETLKLATETPAVLVIGGSLAELRFLGQRYPKGRFDVVSLSEPSLQEIKDAVSAQSFTGEVRLFKADASQLEAKDFPSATYDVIFAEGVDASASITEPVLRGMAAQEERLLRRGGFIYHRYVNTVMDLEDISLYHEEAVREGRLVPVIHDSKEPSAILKQAVSGARLATADRPKSDEFSDLEISPAYTALKNRMSTVLSENEVRAISAKTDEFLRHQSPFSFRSARALVHLIDLLFSPYADQRIGDALLEFEATYGLVGDNLNTNAIAQNGSLLSFYFAHALLSRDYEILALSAKVRTEAGGAEPDAIVRDLRQNETLLAEFKSTVKTSLSQFLDGYAAQMKKYIRTVLLSEPAGSASEIFPQELHIDAPAGVLLVIGDTLLEGKEDWDAKSRIQNWFGQRVEEVLAELNERGIEIKNNEPRLEIEFVDQPFLYAENQAEAGKIEQANPRALSVEQWNKIKTVFDAYLADSAFRLISPGRSEIYSYFLNRDGREAVEALTDEELYNKYLKLGPDAESRSREIRSGARLVAPSKGVSYLPSGVSFAANPIDQDTLNGISDSERDLVIQLALKGEKVLGKPVPIELRLGKQKFLNSVSVVRQPKGLNVVFSHEGRQTAAYRVSDETIAGVREAAQLDAKAFRLLNIRHERDRLDKEVGMAIHRADISEIDVAQPVIVRYMIKDYFGGAYTPQIAERMTQMVEPLRDTNVAVQFIREDGVLSEESQKPNFSNPQIVVIGRADQTNTEYAASMRFVPIEPQSLKGDIYSVYADQAILRLAVASGRLRIQDGKLLTTVPEAVSRAFATLLPVSARQEFNGDKLGFMNAIINPAGKSAILRKISIPELAKLKLDEILALLGIRMAAVDTSA